MKTGTVQRTRRQPEIQGLIHHCRTARSHRRRQSRQAERQPQQHRMANRGRQTHGGVAGGPGIILSTGIAVRCVLRDQENAAAQGDFYLAAKKFTQQYPNLPITIRLSADFHDRFSILDGQRCFHIGASIKDAGKKAFLISEAEDPNNRTALMTQATQTWTAANAYIISAG